MSYAICDAQCDTPISYDSFVCDMAPTRHGPRGRAPPTTSNVCIIHPSTTPAVTMRHTSCDVSWGCVCKCVTWPIHMCVMTHSIVCHDSFICVRRPIHLCVGSCECVCRPKGTCIRTHTTNHTHTQTQCQNHLQIFFRSIYIFMYAYMMCIYTCFLPHTHKQAIDRDMRQAQAQELYRGASKCDSRASNVRKHRVLYTHARTHAHAHMHQTHKNTNAHAQTHANAYSLTHTHTHTQTHTHTHTHSHRRIHRNLNHRRPR